MVRKNLDRDVDKQIGVQENKCVLMGEKLEYVQESYMVCFRVIEIGRLFLEFT